MTDPEIREILDDYEACERHEFSLVVLAGTVARKVVRSGEPDFLERLPDRLRDAVLNMARVYQRDGELVFQSNLGMVYHNDLGAALVQLLRSSGRHSLS